MLKANNEQLLNQQNVLSNAEAINKFFFWYGSKTTTEFSKFLFDVLVHFVNNEPEEQYGTEYKDSVMLHLRMLHDLVTSLKYPYEIPVA